MQDVLCISGGRKLSGTVPVSGAKNAALPLLFATLLSEEQSEIRNVPDLQDIAVTLRLLRSLGAIVSFENGVVRIGTPSIKSTEAPYSAVKALRASFWALGPLLARAGEAQVSLPGGDAIGTRPVDLHLNGMQRFGADIHVKHGVVYAAASGGLKPAEVALDFASVGATHNLLMTAALIPGESVIRGAAKEPEVVDLAKFLTEMGAEISGAGTDTVKIKGCRQLGGAQHAVLGDRIEAATYLLSGVVSGGKVKVTGVDPTMLVATLDILRAAGCEVAAEGQSIEIEGPERFKAASFETAPHPGVATDMQPLLMAVLSRAQGTSLIRETVFESRFGHAAEYRRFGADITIDGRLATVTGVDTLSAAPVEARDIRAAAGLVLMGLMAEGVTQVSELHHLDRGYDGLVEKLCGLGGELVRVPSTEARELVVGC